MSATSSFFLGPRRGRWTPGDWDGLAQAVSSGILNESRWVELKGGLPPNQKGGVEIGRDLASLALDAGLLVVGVSEASRGVAGEACGVDLAAARDRIDQIARNVPSPPIYVETREIPDPERPGHGVLLVGVPGSGPHMVDGRYWGRGDTGKTMLSDAQVRERLARRQVAEDDVLAQVRALEAATPRYDDRDPRPMPRLFVRAVPTTGRRDALLELLRDDSGRYRVLEVLAEIERQRPGPAMQSVVADAHWWGRFARGRTLTSLDPSMTPDRDETTLRLEENGAVDLAAGLVGSYSSRTWGGGSIPTVRTGIVLSAVHDVAGLAGRLADRYAANPGPWIIAVRVDALEGCYDWSIARGASHFPPAYTGQPDYEDVTTTTTAELVEQPWAVAGRLLARLVRALGAERVFLPYEPGSPAAALATS